MKPQTVPYMLLVIALTLTPFVPISARAAPPSPAAPSPEAPSPEERLRQQLQTLGAHLDALPLPTTSPRTGSVAADVEALLLPAELSIHATAPLLDWDALRAAAGTPPINASSVASIDINDLSNSINKYTPYALIGGASAVDLGLVYSGGLVGPGTFDAVRFCPACWDPGYYSRGSVGATTIANALQMADSQLNARLDMVTSLLNGNWNQYLGGIANAGGWSATFAGQSPFFSGVNTSYTGASTYVQSVLGYNPSSPYNFSTQFLMNMNSLYTPWTSFDYGFGGWGIWSSDADSPRSLVDELTLKFKALGTQQQHIYFTDAALGNLRSESNTILIGLMYGDPWYLYFDYALRNYLTQIYTTRATYSTVVALAAEIAGWDDAPTDPATLQMRHNKRLELEFWFAVLEFEVLWYLYFTPGALQWVTDVNQFLGERLLAAWGSQQAVDWYQGWQQRWHSTYNNTSGFATLRTQVETLTADYPAFEEYMRRNQRVRDLLPTFAELPDVQQLTQQTEALLNNQAVADQVDGYYQTYTEAIGSALGKVAFDAALERYYEELNALVYADDLYQLLTTVKYGAVLLLDQFQQDVYNAVYACLYYLGDQCDPYIYSDVVMLYGQNFYDLMELVGDFYETHTLYWFVFYQSNDYVALEERSAEVLSQTIEPIAEEIEEARVAFTAAAAAIPEIDNLRSSSEQLISRLRNNAAVAAASPALAAASAELDENLSRMSELVAQMTAPQPNPTPVPTYTVYLPLTTR